MAVGQLLTEDPPVQTVPQGMPPGANTPQQVAQNKGLWRTFLDGIQQNLADPNIKKALFATGTGLMQSPGYGQNGWDVASHALQTGAGTLERLREQDRALALQAQTRKEALAQQNIQNTLQSRTVGATERNAATNEAQAQAQASQAATNANITDSANQEVGRHNLTAEQIAQQNADSDRIRAEAEGKRAKAYAAGTAGKTPQDIQKINNLAAQFIAEGMDETGAKAKATMMLELGSKAKSPGEQARLLYQERLTGWSNSIENIGKSMTPEQAKQLLEDSIADVVKLQTFDKNTTGQMVPSPGASVPPTQRSGPIIRNSPVGTMQNGYKKVKDGKDSDESTWAKQ